MNQRSQRAVRRTVGGPSATAAVTTVAAAAACVTALLLFLVAETAAAPSSPALNEDTDNVAAVYSSLLAAQVPPSRRLHKRSFFDLQCKGVYDKRIFATLDRICEDCYNLFREPSIHSLCRKNCFTTTIFKGCVETLQLEEKEQEIKEMIKQLHGADPGL